MRDSAVTFNVSKTKLLAFHHHRADPEFSLSHDERLFFKRVCLALNVTEDFGKMLDSLYRSRKYLTLSVMHFLYKRLKMRYSDGLSSTLRFLSYRRNVARLSLLSRYFHSKSCDRPGYADKLNPRPG